MYCTHTESHDVNALDELAGSWRTLLQRRRADVMTVILKVWHHVVNPTRQSIRIYNSA